MTGSDWWIDDTPPSVVACENISFKWRMGFRTYLGGFFAWGGWQKSYSNAWTLSHVSRLPWKGSIHPFLGDRRIRRTCRSYNDHRRRGAPIWLGRWDYCLQVVHSRKIMFRKDKGGGGLQRGVGPSPRYRENRNEKEPPAAGREEKIKLRSRISPQVFSSLPSRIYSLPWHRDILSSFHISFSLRSTILRTPKSGVVPVPCPSQVNE